MPRLGELLAALTSTLSFSWVAIPFALVPVGFVAMKAREPNSRWRIPSANGTAVRKIPYVWLGILGGIAGEIVAVNSLFFAGWWSCHRGSELCHDEQSWMLLMFSLPALSFFGSLLSLTWTWFTLGINTREPFASVFLYEGPNRFLNRVVALGIQLIFWPLALLILTLMTPS